MERKNIKLLTGTLNGYEYKKASIEISYVPNSINFSDTYTIKIINVDLRSENVKSCITRIKTALFTNNYKIKNGEYIVSISSDFIKADGTHFDLVIIIGILYLNNYIQEEFISHIKKVPIYGEVSLQGFIKSPKKIFSLCLGAYNLKKRTALIPKICANQVSNLPNFQMFLINHIDDLKNFELVSCLISPEKKYIESETTPIIDMNDIYGQEAGKRAITIAAAGSHNCILYGPPGCGKTMLAKAMQGILPRLSEDELLEVNNIYSSAGLLSENDPLIFLPPFRSPHHSSTIVGLIGGGSDPYPGDVTLAHRGILFLDEFLEIRPQKIEMLRQIMEEKKVNLKKNKYNVTYPANFRLIAAFNPCPCGYYGSKQKNCVCSVSQIKHYMKSLSGPIIDRIDLQVSLETVKLQDITTSKNETSSTKYISEKVKQAIDIQYRRYGVGKLNGTVEGKEIEKHANLSDESKKIMYKLIDLGKISLRTYFKIIRVARTAADLECNEVIEKNHIFDALNLRSIEKLGLTNDK